MYLRTADAETRWQPIGVIITKRCSDIDKLYVSLVSFSSAQLNSIWQTLTGPPCVLGKNLGVQRCPLLRLLTTQEGRLA